MAGNLIDIVSRANLIRIVASARPKLEVTLSDFTIRQKLLSELKKQSWAHTQSGRDGYERIVDLWGYAQSDDERKAIRVAAETIPGVVVVNDHLADSPALSY